MKYYVRGINGETSACARANTPILVCNPLNRSRHGDDNFFAAIDWCNSKKR